MRPEIRRNPWWSANLEKFRKEVPRIGSHLGAGRSAEGTAPGINPRSNGRNEFEMRSGCASGGCRNEGVDDPEIPRANAGGAAGGLGGLLIQDVEERRARAGERASLHGQIERLARLVDGGLVRTDSGSGRTGVAKTVVHGERSADRHAEFPEVGQQGLHRLQRVLRHPVVLRIEGDIDPPRLPESPLKPVADGVAGRLVDDAGEPHPVRPESRVQTGPDVQESGRTGHLVLLELRTGLGRKEGRRAKGAPGDPVFG